MATADDIFVTAIHALPPSEKLRLAAMILVDLSKTAGPNLDYSDTWTADDVRDLAAYAQQCANEQFSE